MNKQRALDAVFLESTDRIPHWESFSNPDFEKLLTGIDPWKHPQLARLRMLELIPQDIDGGVPLTNEGIEYPREASSNQANRGERRTVRWGTGQTAHWEHGSGFATIDDVLAYDPLADMDLGESDIVGGGGVDYTRSVAEIAREKQELLDRARKVTGERALVTAGFYNTLFMWPLLTFGWELFLEAGAAHPEQMKRQLAGFAERSRKIFQALALTDVEVVTSHDDICYAAGPVFSPRWLREMIYPYYEEFWGYVRAAGKKLIFVCDGDVTGVADDIFACGADGIRSEPFTDWEKIIAGHPDKILAGDGDNRILSGGEPGAIDRMVREMSERGKACPGYFFCVGNHLPWNLPAEAIRRYFDASERYGRR